VPTGESVTVKLKLDLHNNGRNPNLLQHKLCQPAPGSVELRCAGPINHLRKNARSRDRRLDAALPVSIYLVPRLTGINKMIARQLLALAGGGRLLNPFPEVHDGGT
jgi:hypothetical protein